ncbi:Pentatricopeptide repeat [Quillaja saponaria]|uniref:Pentatricopeptide repeat n=1 Tax=Quillaja saponaria TaxID=32244 RepID=A0AAD7L641_QUISA|nr:Pentatricopeptide repeat [Quillaja saponaria]
MLTGYAQYGLIGQARMVFESIPERNVVSWNAMISGFVKNGDLKNAREFFDRMPKRNVTSWNSMITGYCHCGMMREAHELFDHMEKRNYVSWMVMISGHVEMYEYLEAWDVFLMMIRHGVKPEQSIFVVTLSAVTGLNNLELVESLRTVAIKTGYEENVVVGTALLNAFTRNGCLDCAFEFFETMPERNEYTWSAIVAALYQCERLEEAKDIFLRIPVKNATSWAAMIAGFVQNGHSREALKLFSELHRSGMIPSHSEWDVVSWTAIISAYEQAEQGDIAFELFCKMLDRGVKPNQSAITSLLSACRCMGVTTLGEQIHALAHKVGLNACLFVSNALISMYFKCGSLDGFPIFQEMSDRDIVPWNAVLAGCGQNGLGMEGIEIFRQMQAAGTLPNAISFLGVLCACSHADLVDRGWEYFHSMHQDYGIMPLVHHYTCMVSLFGRAGRLSSAEKLIENLPVQPDIVIWEALLGACRIHHNIKLGQKIAERLLQMGARRSSTYVLLCNIYACQGMWKEVLELRETMKDKGISKEPGISWIQIKNKLHYFLMGDQSHSEITEIHSKLKELYICIRKAGYVPDTSFALHDVEEEQKQDELLYHSEKLALAYAILRTPNGAPIHIMKNLQVCADCHSFMKFASKTTHCKIIVRDVNRFHHFKDSSCSCGKISNSF